MKRSTPPPWQPTLLLPLWLALHATPLAAQSEPVANDGASRAQAASPFTGLAQAPEANLFSGSATTAIPIDVPPGRKAMTPRLSLGYSSSAGPSPYGHGWDLPIGRVQRSGKHGILGCNDTAARRDFVLTLPTGTVECRLDDGGAARVACRPLVEQAFWRIEFADATNSWEVWEKSGTQYVFGETDDSRAGSSLRQPWRDGTTCTYTHTWALTRVVDPNGNHVDLAWDRVDGVLHPRHIRYGGNRNTRLAHLFEVRFLWQERQPGNRPTRANGGHAARVSRLLDRIEVSQPVGGKPLRTYDLTYDVDSGESPRSARLGFLRSATVFGRNGAALARYDGLPASTILLYRDVDEADRRFDPRFVAAPTAAGAPALQESISDTSTTSTTVELRDMNGDGHTDLVDTRACHVLTQPYWDVYLGSNDGFAADPIAWGIAPGDEKSCRIRFTGRFPNSTQTLAETIDIDGDRIPDWVDARSLPWRVFLGERAAAGTGWRFGRHLAVTPRAQENGQVVTALRVSDGPDDWLDLLDWNGDGLVDQVNAREGRVHLGNGTGFTATGERVTFPSRRLGRTEDGRTTEGLYDVNGDSLLDLVRSDDANWYVWLREGMRLTAARETWRTPTSCSRGLRDRRDDDTWRDYFDINGDGLPDIVDSCSWTPESPYWTVTLGRGDGFHPDSTPWHSFHSRVRRESGNRTRRTQQDVIDMDGDGILDLVRWEAKAPRELWILHNAAGAWHVGCAGSCLVPAPSEALPDALVRLENGVGGTTELAYVPSTTWDNEDEAGNAGMPLTLWTVSRIERSAGMAGRVLGYDTIRRELRYAFGLFDPRAREFRGFGAVQDIDASGTRATTLFAQDHARKGQVLSHTIHAAGADPRNDVPLRAVVHDWVCVDRTSGAERPCDDLPSAEHPLWVRQRASHVYDYAADGSHRHAWKEFLAWDRYGNVTHVRSGGDASQQVETRVDFAHAANADSSGPYIVDRPAREHISGTHIEERWFFYDDQNLGRTTRGNLTRTEERLDTSVVAVQPCTADARAGCTRTRLAYDGNGNVVRLIDAEARVTSTEFAANALYPSRETNALGQVVVSDFDLGCGKLLQRSLLDAFVGERHEYDEFCRPVALLLPGQTAATAQRRVSYYLGGPGVATDVFSREREPSSPTGWVEVDELFDGLGRKLQSQRAAVVDGARVVLAADTLELDPRGLGRASRAPYSIEQTFLAGAAVYAMPPAGERTYFEYDAVGRMTQSLDASGAERRVDFSTPWQSTAVGECFDDPSCLGARTLRRLDAYGNTIEKAAFDEQGRQLAGTRYTHDSRARVLTSQQWDGKRWSPSSRITIDYDSLGRRTRLDDPDSGSWRFGYDRVGNLIYHDDPEPKRHVELCYDDLDRLTQKHVVDGSDEFRGDRCADPSAAEIVYTYDAPEVPFATGRLTHVRDRSGTTSFQAYDAQGRVLSRTRNLDVDGFVERSTMSFGYDGGGHLRTLTYPDGERVEYGYDEVGNLRSLYSLRDGTSYLTDLSYDRFARPRQITHGNGAGGLGVVDTREYHASDQLFRLARITTTAPAGGSSCKGTGTLLDLHFTRYSADGKLLQRVDQAVGCGGLDASGDYTYDGLGRLTRVTLPTGLSSQYEHDTLGNLTSKDAQRITYDTGRPHRPTQVGSIAIDHDRNGNRIRKGNARYGFDADDRLVEVDGGAVRIEYDHSGRQAWRSVGNVTTRYLDEFAEYRIEGGRTILTKHYFVGDHRLASREVHWEPQLASPQTAAAGLAGQGRSWAGLLGMVGFAMAVGWVGWPRRRRRLGSLRFGARLSVLVALVFFLGTLPGLPRQAHGNGNSVSTVPRTPSPGSASLRLLHYHTDQGGTPLVISDAEGRLLQALRYDVHGALRQQWPTASSGGAPAGGFGFTGYGAEPASGLQYAGVRWYDPQLGSFLSHDPARQYTDPYSYGGGDPINGTDRAGAFFGLDDLLVAVVIGIIAGSAGSGIQAAIQGASLGDALQAAAIGGALGGATAYVGAGFVAPALGETVMPWVATQLVSAGMSHATAGSVAQIAIYGGTIGGGLATTGQQAAKGNYAPLIALGVAVGLNAVLTPPPATNGGVELISVADSPQSDLLTPKDLQIGDVLITDGEGVTGAVGHASIVVDAEGEMVKVLSADSRGVYVASNADAAVGGRQWDVYRVVSIKRSAMNEFLAKPQTNGGLAQYLGNRGGNVCSATVAKTVENFGGPLAPRIFMNLVTPAQLRETYGPPIGRVYIPLSKGI